METILDAALSYRDIGLSVIPVQRNKKPFIKWENFQKHKADRKLIQEWFQTWPGANIAIVTGEISGINVIDIDTHQGRDALNEILPDSLITPTATTPGGGWHYYFKNQNGIGNATRFIEGCDFRGEGGYIIAPPSKGYSWQSDLSIKDVDLAFLPEAIIKAFKNPKKLPEKIIEFNQGKRDDTLFHTALSLLKGNMPIEEVNKVILSLAANCNPPFSEKEALAKVKSAFEHLGNKENLMQEIRDWIQGVSGIFSNKQLMEELDIPRIKKGHVSKYLNRFIEEGLIVKAGGKYGNWRRVEEELQRISLKKRPNIIVDVKLPFDLNNMVEIRPGNIIVLAGFQNAGKTSLILNMIADNMYKHKCNYFTSEMGIDELNMRLDKFDNVPREDWDKYVNAYPRSENFADVIRAGKGNVNFIDYIEMSDEFYKIGGYLTEIHNRLDGAIAIIALQKNPGVDVGLGGYRSLEKPRLYIAIDPGKIKIVKAKNWKSKTNPNGLEMSFKLHHGTEFQPTSGWLRVDPKKKGK